MTKIMHQGYRSVLFLFALIFFLSGCATPIGVRKVGTEKAYQEINASALMGNEISSDTKIVLHRFDLLEQFDDDPAAVISLIHKKATRDMRRDLRFALAELCYYYGKKLPKSGRLFDNAHRIVPADYFLMSAVYAYYYLFSAAGEEPPRHYDRRFRFACDLYNRALGKGLATGKKGRMEFKDGVRELPVGRLSITLKSDLFPWPLEAFQEFTPADDYAVRGLSVRNRTPGVGLPLVALHKKTPEMPKGPAIPITAFLRLEGDVSDLGNGSEKASLELYSAYEETEVTVNDQQVPLETDSTTPLAYRLEDSQIWKVGLRNFLSANRQEPELLLIQPYQPDRIPIVFVHGTASSPVWWAEMWNTLRSDPVLRKRCQFWFFKYNSSVPVMISAASLRNTLSEMVAKVDPDGENPYLHQMVVVGHSQGGLLTKMCVVETGDKLWWALSRKSYEEFKAEPEVKERLREYLFIEPLPFVKRVVYISTPHRGSFRVKSWVRNLVRRFVKLPRQILTGDPRNFINLFKQSKLPKELRGKTLTSVDGMSPENPLLKTLSEMPVGSGVTAHSIIAVKGDEDPKTGNDGVVEYTSAHQEGVASELIVRAGHSCQGHPLTIEEVRRIILNHLRVERQ